LSMPAASAPQFDEAFRAQFEKLPVWQRDVRRFREQPLPEGFMERLLSLACLAPPVGLSEPWRFVLVEEAGRRLGWVSIVGPSRINRDLDVSPHWRFIGYFCLGYPAGTREVPRLHGNAGKNAPILPRSSIAGELSLRAPRAKRRIT
jgi:nitroreductase